MLITISIQNDDEFITETFDNYQSALNFIVVEEDIDLDATSDTYDYQGMPEDIKDEFFNMHDAGNDCYVDHYIRDPDNIVDNYFIELGEKLGSSIVVKHWW